MGGGGGGYGDGLAGDGGVIKIGVIAVTGVFHDGNNGAVILFGDVIGDLLAGKGCDKRLNQGIFLVSFLYRQDIGVGRGGALQRQRILGGIEPGGNGIVGIDDGIVNIGQQVGQLGSLYLAELNVLGVFGDIQNGGGDAHAVLELDVALILQKQQRTGFVGGVIGDGDFEGRFAGGIAAGGQRQQQANDEQGRDESLESLFHGDFPFFFGVSVGCGRKGTGYGHIRPNR